MSDKLQGKKPLHFMIDLETLSTKPNAAILSVGAVAATSNSATPNFYAKIEVAEYEKISFRHKFDINPNTIAWWNEQDPAVRAESFSGMNLLSTVMHHFADWIRINCEVNNSFPVIWGNGAAFDNVVLKHALEFSGITNLWSYKHDMCYRTICTMFPFYYETAKLLVPANETKHNALADAQYQARILESILNQLGEEGIVLWQPR